MTSAAQAGECGLDPDGHRENQVERVASRVTNATVIGVYNCVRWHSKRVEHLSGRENQGLTGIRRPKPA